MKNQTASQPAETPVLEFNTQSLLSALAAKGGPPIHELSIADAHGVLSGAQAGKVATLEQLRGLRPALVSTPECDVLRDKDEAYARRLIAAGVRVTATRYLGTIHDFVMLNAITDTPAPRGAIAQANDVLRKLFVQ